MKRRNKIIALIFILALALTAFAACSGGTESVRLSTPVNLQINGTTLTWDEVENASGYMVNIDGSGKTTTENTYSLSTLTEPGKYNIQVRALGDRKTYSDSEWSQAIEYTVLPENEQSLEFGFYMKTTKYYEVTGIGTVTSNEIVVPPTYNGLPVVSIGKRAFENNVNITNVTLSENIRDINNFAFSGCTALETIDIYTSHRLKTIQRGAFSGSGLKTLIMPDSIDNIPYAIIDNCINLEYIRFSEGLIMISDQFFNNTPKLTSIVLPNSLSYIAKNVFVGSSIESIKIPKAVEYIGESAFEDTIINSIEFEEGSLLEEIGQSAFKGCNNLESIIIPANVTTIGLFAFSDCANLKSVTFEENCKLTTLEMLFDDGTGINEFTIPKSVTTLGDMAFYNVTALETVRFEDYSEVTELPFELFYYCTNLTTVDFGEGSKIDTIGPNVFMNCTSLKEIDIPKGVTSIGYQAFSNTTAMKSITISLNIETMGDRVFSGWTENQTIYIEDRLEAPADWSSSWNYKSDAVIVWGYTTNSK